MPSLFKFNILFRSVLFVLIFISLQSHSKEGGGEAKGGGKEGGEAAKGGEAPKGAAEAKKNPEWMDLNTQLQTLKTKVEMSEGSIKKMIEEKNQTHDEKQSAEIIKNLIKEHRDLTKTVEEYEQRRNQLKYRFPEAGLNDEREYERMEVRSLQEMENEFTIEGRLKKTFNRVKQQYPKSYEAVQKKKTKASSGEGSSDKSHGSNSSDRDHSATEGNPQKYPRKNKENTLAEPAVISK